MKKEISEKIEIPAGLEVDIDGSRIKIKKEGKESVREYCGFEIKKEDNFIVLHHKKATKKEKKLIKTTKAHIKNIILGFEKKFVYKLKICSVHFPMNVSIDKAKNEIIVKNFLGEVKPRVARIVRGAEVKIEKDTIIVESQNNETAGQTAANIEGAVKINNRDRRTFQDGIYITEKPEY